MIPGSRLPALAKTFHGKSSLDANFHYVLTLPLVVLTRYSKLSMWLEPELLTGDAEGAPMAGLPQR